MEIASSRFTDSRSNKRDQLSSTAANAAAGDALDPARSASWHCVINRDGAA